MKINPFAGATPMLNTVREKQDTGNRQQQGHQQKQQKEPEKDFDQELDQAKLSAAVDAFQTDATTQAHGLSAAAVGKGPGLRIVLKDVSGTVLRQFTGEEFLKLREAASQDGKSRGKILDRKL